MLDRRLELGAPEDLVANAIRRLLGGAGHAAALALQPPQHGINDSADVDLVGGPAGGPQVCAQIQRLTRLELDVAVVADELPHRADGARPLPGPDEEVESPRAAGIGSLRPDEHLGHE